MLGMAGEEFVNIECVKVHLALYHVRMSVVLVTGLSSFVWCGHVQCRQLLEVCYSFPSDFLLLNYASFFWTTIRWGEHFSPVSKNSEGHLVVWQCHPTLGRFPYRQYQARTANLGPFRKRPAHMESTFWRVDTCPSPSNVAAQGSKQTAIPPLLVPHPRYFHAAAEGIYRPGLVPSPSFF
jgi:hypothetical protein